MKIKELYNHIDKLYPRTLSCELDNDGLMCTCDDNVEVTKVLVSLDATEAAIVEAAKRSCNVLLTHHPMLFDSPRTVNGNNYLGKRIIAAVENGVSVMSFHTRLDVGEDGVNDRLVKALGYKCSGSFGDDESPSLGRLFTLENDIDADELAKICKKKLGSGNVKITGFGKGRSVCVVGGSGGSFVDAAIVTGADILITGECSYNSAQDAFEKGLIVIEAGHYETEFPVCSRFEMICNELGIASEVFDSRITKNL